MEVKIATSNGKTEFSKPRATIKKSFFEMEGNTVSNVVVEGDATYDEKSNTLTFNSNGTVKLTYSVTNAFGTFNSNVLELTYNDGTTPAESKKGCNSNLTVCDVVLALAMLSVATVFIVKKGKNN